MLPLAVVRVTLPVVLVEIVVPDVNAVVILPVFVIRFTDCIVLLPRAALIAIPFVPPALFTVRFVTPVPMLMV